MKKILFIVFLVLSIIGGLTSCGTRKVQNSDIEIKKEETTTSKLVDNTVSDVKIETDNDIATHDVILEPIKQDLPIEVIQPDGKKTTYKNAKISYHKSQDNTKAIETKKVVENKQNDTTVQAKSKVAVITHTSERTSKNWWWLLLLLIPLGYFAWQKFKDKVWFI
jgi:uncharacterized protein YxeA